MSSLDSGAMKSGTRAGSLLRLLDLAFGFFVWAAHLLAVYGATAVACVLGLGAASAQTHMLFRGALVLVTAAAAALVVWHALRRYRQRQDGADHQFRALVAAGADAIATVAIVWQLFPILLVRACV